MNQTAAPRLIRGDLHCCKSAKERQSSNWATTDRRFAGCQRYGHSAEPGWLFQLFGPFFSPGYERNYLHGFRSL